MLSSSKVNYTINVCQIDDDEEPNMLVVNFISKIVKSPRVTGHLLTISFLGVIKLILRKKKNSRDY